MLIEHVRALEHARGPLDVSSKEATPGQRVARYFSQLSNGLAFADMLPPGEVDLVPHIACRMPSGHRRQS